MKKYLSMLFLAVLIISIVPASVAAANPECGYTIQLKNKNTKNAVLVSKLTKYNAKGIKIRADVWVRYYVKGKSNPYFISFRKYLGANQNSLTWSYKLPYAYRASIIEYKFKRV